MITWYPIENGPLIPFDREVIVGCFLRVGDTFQKYVTLATWKRDMWETSLGEVYHKDAFTHWTDDFDYPV